MPRLPFLHKVKIVGFLLIGTDVGMIDSPDHKANVAYPSSASFESTGPCPASHPVRLPQVMYEVMWDTTPFNDKELWPLDGSNPFVYSMGDP